MWKSLLLGFLAAGLLGFVVISITPPASFTSASLTQLAYFFLPAFLLVSSLANLYFRFWPRSFSFGIGATLLLIFQALGMFNIVTIVLTASATFLIIRSFKKPKNNSLKQTQISSLSRLKKQ